MFNDLKTSLEGTHVSLTNLFATGSVHEVELSSVSNISIGDYISTHHALAGCITKVRGLDGTTSLEVSARVEIVVPFSVIKMTRSEIWKKVWLLSKSKPPIGRMKI